MGWGWYKSYYNCIHITNYLDIILMIIKYLLNSNYGCGTKTNAVLPMFN